MTQTDTGRRALTRSELLELPATVDVETAASAFGIGRTTGYALAKAGQFPCRLIRAGRSYRVITADMLRVLLVSPERGDAVGVAAPTASVETHHSASAN